MKAGLGLLAGAFALSGCAGYGVATSKIEQFTLHDTLALSAPSRNFMQAAEQAGTALGYRVSGTDAGANAITFTNSSGAMTGAILGKITYYQMQVSLDGGRRTVLIDVMASGNWKIADRARVEAKVSEYKAALRERLR